MEKRKIITRICPECQSKKIKQDYIHQEQYCYQCGLLLQAPKIHNINTPGYAIKIQTYVQLINTPVLISEKILQPEQFEKLKLRELEILYPPVSEESKL